MIRTVSFFAGLLVFLAVSPGAKAEGVSQSADFKEVYDLIRAHLTGITESDLNQAAVQGLISALKPKVSIVGAAGSPAAASDKPLVSKSGVLEDDIAYVRIRQVGDGLAKAVKEACEKLGATNHLKGVVLDLRYADGQDYEAAVATVELFVKKEQPLLDWGKGMVQSKENGQALTLPVAALVNHETGGAPEALAAAIRETGTGLILGSPTAGQAMIAQEFPLNNGQKLRIATTPIRLADGSLLSTDGLKPDISVEVKPEEERAYYADAFQANSRPGGAGSLSATNGLSGTNRSARRTRFNEAELVRERKEGLGPELDAAGDKAAARDEQPAVQDPALARALDVLKGLAVVRHSRS